MKCSVVCWTFWKIWITLVFRSKLCKLSTVFHTPHHKMIFWTEPHIVVSYSAHQMLAFLAPANILLKPNLGKMKKINFLNLYIFEWVTSIFSFHKNILEHILTSFLLAYLLSFSSLVVEGDRTQADPKSHKLTMRKSECNSSFFSFICVSREIHITHLILISFNAFYVSSAVSSEFK